MRWVSFEYTRTLSYQPGAMVVMVFGTGLLFICHVLSCGSGHSLAIMSCLVVSCGSGHSDTMAGVIAVSREVRLMLRLLASAHD